MSFTWMGHLLPVCVERSQIHWQSELLIRKIELDFSIKYNRLFAEWHVA